MRVAVDGAGRVVIPKRFREHLGLGDGGVAELTLVDGWLELRPMGPRVWVEERDGQPVAVTDDPEATLTVDEVRDVIEAVRR
jgi:AbrB family looped-hinge helix DNA binding protein